MSTLTKAYGVEPRATPAIVAAGMFRTAGVAVLHDDIPRHTVSWFHALAVELADYQTRGSINARAHAAVEEILPRLHHDQAVGVLAVLAPHQRLAAGTAREVSVDARHQVALVLPGFCKSVLERLDSTVPVELSDEDSLPADDFDPPVRRRVTDRPQA